jgi:hypothetical protein
MSVHAPGCECGAYACELRAKGITFDPGAARSTPRKGKPGSNAEHNGWERQLAGENRPGGTFMPYIDRDKNGNLTTVPIKEGVAKRHKYREIRRRQHDQAVSAGHHH